MLLEWNNAERWLYAFSVPDVFVYRAIKILITLGDTLLKQSERTISFNKTKVTVISRSTTIIDVQ